MTDNFSKILSSIANRAQDSLENCQPNTAEFGYYLGIMQLTSILNKAIKQGRAQFELDYDSALRLWKCYLKETSNPNQISMEDIIPGILSRLNKIDKLLKEHDKDKK